MRALVAHPGMQHAHQVALALHERGELGAFWSGLPVLDHAAGAGRLLPDAWRSRLPDARLPLRLRRHVPLFPLVQRALMRHGGSLGAAHAIDHLFDALIASALPLERPDVVIAFENSAQRTFEAAERVGALKVLSASSVHHASQAAWLGADAAGTPHVVARKAREIELADLVVTCSDLATQTYRDAGVPAEKLVSVPLGTDLPASRPPPPREAGPFRFVFAGTVRALKGLDLLLPALRAFTAEGLPIRLTLVGGSTDPELLRALTALAVVDHVGHVPRDRLFALFAEHDCLVLPSRFDSFGMVVPEAMAAGIPAIVSERVGAKCIIEQHPDAGWIVPLEPAALEAAMRRVATDGAHEAHRRAARHAAEQFTWPRFRARFADVIEARHAATRARRR